jgi:hypothetical protein
MTTDRSGQSGGQGGNASGNGSTAGPNGARNAGGGGIKAGQSLAASGQKLGSSGAAAGFTGKFGGTQNEANKTVTDAAKDFAKDTAITTFDQLRAMQTGTATFFLGNIPLTQVRGPNSTNSSGSYDASLAIDFGARTLHFVVNNVVYIFNGGADQTFAYDNAGVGTGTRYATDKGNVQGTDDALNKTGNFTPPPPTDGSAVDVTGQIRNDQDAGKVAARALVTVTINNGTDVISGEGTAAAATGGGCCV